MLKIIFLEGRGLGGLGSWEAAKGLLDSWWWWVSGHEIFRLGKIATKTSHVMLLFTTLMNKSLLLQINRQILGQRIHNSSTSASQNEAYIHAQTQPFENGGSTGKYKASSKQSTNSSAVQNNRD